MMPWLWLVSAGLQVLMAAALIALEILSGKRGGVNHHVLARKHQWSQGLLSQERLGQLDMLLLGSALILLVFLVCQWKKGVDKSRFLRLANHVGWVLGLLLFTGLSYRLEFLQQLRISPYMTMAAALAAGVHMAALMAYAAIESQEIK